MIFGDNNLVFTNAVQFFKRVFNVFSLLSQAHIVPYVVTKKTVFKWQEGFWTMMKDVFDKHYKLVE